MYTKLTAPRIFNGFHFLAPGSVLIFKGQTVQDIVPFAEAGDDIQMLEGMLTPGFINAHCHTELSYLKGSIPTHTGLVDFVQQVLQKRQNGLHAVEIEQAVEQLQQSGTVAVADICNTTDSIAAKRNSSIQFKNFIEVSGFVDAAAEKRFLEMLSVQQCFADNDLQSTIVPHAPYSVSPSLFTRINQHTQHQLISIHNQECAAENIFFKNGTGKMLELYKNLGIDIGHFKPSGKSSLQTWLPYFNSQKIIAVHNTYINEDDVNVAGNLQFCICIKANLYIENTLPPIDMLMKKGVHMVLGTDSLASNNSLDMYEEIKVIHQHFPQLPEETVLQWATSNGAKTLDLQHQLGSFDKGKNPGIVQVVNGKATSVTI